jgi:hypothetical protein
LKTWKKKKKKKKKSQDARESQRIVFPVDQRERFLRPCKVEEILVVVLVAVPVPLFP